MIGSKQPRAEVLRSQYNPLQPMQPKPSKALFASHQAYVISGACGEYHNWIYFRGVALVLQMAGY